MSKTVSGRVQATSDQEDDDYFGICIDDTWYNGPGSLKKNLQEAEIELEIDDNEESFIDIKEINILEEANEDGAQSRNGSDSPTGSGNSNGAKSSSQNPQMSERQANIMANSSVKIAVEDTDLDYEDDPAAWNDRVNEKSQSVQNIMKQRLGENL